jgi:hypothetical protein
MVPVVLHTSSAVTARAFRPLNGVVPGLRSDDLLLNARQQPLRFGQGQTQVGDIDEIIGLSDFHDVRARPLTLNPNLYQPQHPSHASSIGLPELPAFAVNIHLPRHTTKAAVTNLARHIREELTRHRPAA